jgi:SAM-dependent methyltransferase
MHDAAKRFTLHVKCLFPDFFKEKMVLDVGSGDINGTNRLLFSNCTYHGNDVVAGPNVTIVSKTADLPYKEGMFDTIVSTECFEHDPQYEQSLKKIVSMLKDGGLFVFTCASTGRPEHGTLRTTPSESFASIANIPGMSDYYKNLIYADIDAAIDVKRHFDMSRCYYNAEPYSDLYFWGIKKGGTVSMESIPEYSGPRVSRVA